MVKDFVPCNALCLGFLYFGFLGLISFTDIDMYRPTRVSRDYGFGVEVDSEFPVRYPGKKCAFAFSGFYGNSTLSSLKIYRLLLYEALKSLLNILRLKYLRGLVSVALHFGFRSGESGDFSPSSLPHNLTM